MALSIIPLLNLKLWIDMWFFTYNTWLEVENKKLKIYYYIYIKKLREWWECEKHIS